MFSRTEKICQKQVWLLSELFSIIPVINILIFVVSSDESDPEPESPPSPPEDEEDSDYSLSPSLNEWVASNPERRISILGTWI